MSGEDELVFLPLGGSGEIGMNLNLYGYGPEQARQWIMVDLGVTFGDESAPGIELSCPDPTFIEERREDLLALVLTHAHEDHIGAAALLWPRLRCPIYATAFTAALVRRKFAEAGVSDPPLTVVEQGARLQIGPFDIQYMTLTHSIPEPNGLAIRTGAGLILHTGDWKIDPSRRRRRSGHDLRFYQCVFRRRIRVGGPGPRGDDQTHRRADGPRRRRHLRL